MIRPVKTESRIAFGEDREGAGPMKRVRTFDFAPTVPLWAALQTIRAALEDEGLALSDANTFGDRSYSTLVTVDGRAYRRVSIPTTRILGSGS